MTYTHGPTYAQTVLKALAPRMPAVQKARVLVERVLEIQPRLLKSYTGSWCELMEPWMRNVEDFDRLLLGVLGERKIGLHFSDGPWEFPLEKAPSLNALRIGGGGELHYAAVGQAKSDPMVLSLLPRWAGAARNFMIVIDRSQREVQRIEAAQKYPGSCGHITIEGKAGAPVFHRSQWLLPEAIPLFNILDFSRPNNLTAFSDLRDLYQDEWLQGLDKEENRNFFLMLFAVANGLRLLDALEKANNPLACSK